MNHALLVFTFMKVQAPKAKELQKIKFYTESASLHEKRHKMAVSLFIKYPIPS